MTGNPTGCGARCVALARDVRELRAFVAEVQFHASSLGRIAGGCGEFSAGARAACEVACGDLCAALDRLKTQGKT